MGGWILSLSDKERQQRSERMRQRNLSTKGKTYEEIYGKKRGQELRKLRGNLSKGRPCSEETKRKISQIRLEKGLAVGEKNSNWRGGISFEFYGVKFTERLKEKIKKRDRYLCQMLDCKETQNLQVHHVDYDKKNNEWWNLITLCISCHGKTNYNREYWQQYFEEIMVGGKIWEVF